VTLTTEITSTKIVILKVIPMPKKAWDLLFIAGGWGVFERACCERENTPDRTRVMNIPGGIWLGSFDSESIIIEER